MAEAALLGHSFFTGLPPEHVRGVGALARAVSFDPGAVLFRTGDAADALYLVTAGRVALEIEVPGRGAVVVETISPGEVLGWSWAVPPHRFRFTARAVERTEALAVDGAALREACAADHDLGYEIHRRLLETVAKRLGHTRIQLLDLYAAP